MEIDSESAAEIEDLIGQIDHNELPFTAIAGAPGSEPVKHISEETTDAQAAKPAQPKNGTWRFKPKSKWTQTTLNKAVDRWCEENQRVLIEGFKDLPFTDAAEATLAMPLLGDNGNLAFRNAANNVIFQIADVKMLALTVSKSDNRQPINGISEPDLVSIDSETSEPNSTDENVFPNGRGPISLFEQFEHVPKQKASWTRDDILKVAHSWADEHARILPAIVTDWRHDTLADMILSRFPEQSDPAVSFNDSLPETLFAPNTRKLFIVTHQ